MPIEVFDLHRLVTCIPPKAEEKVRAKVAGFRVFRQWKLYRRNNTYIRPASFPRSDTSNFTGNQSAGKSSLRELLSGA
ncbi:MAG: hypothetical protein O3B01_25980 [Planctomycetota bacterium]|nr:hypothetical protein [Planctomycetota bacterium]MDA1142026.1 hypothetical protein [Planctomycetota bacterium]